MRCRRLFQSGTACTFGKDRCWAVQARVLTVLREPSVAMEEEER